jgi:SAM-dependent methyltransferase
VEAVTISPGTPALAAPAAAAGPATGLACRSCGDALSHVFADLGASPLANAYLTREQVNQVEPHYPLRALVCSRCFLVQLPAVVPPEAIFGDYAYFSSYSDTLLRHAQTYVEDITARLGLQRGDRVVEIASNDGYLLQYFSGSGVDVLGIEPAANVAETARKKGIPTLVRFFGSALARELAADGRRARLIAANNVLAHVPELNDFIAGLKILLAPGGVATLEFHHLLPLVEQHQFDNIYHEHLQYFSLFAARAALARQGLAVVDVEEFAAQGGSLRVHVQHEDEAGAPHERVAVVLAREEAAGLRELATYSRFAAKVLATKLDLLSFLVEAKRAGHSIACYGAAAKGNTLLNYCGVTADMIDYVVDRNPYKQGHYLPGSHIPVRDPDAVRATRPDYLLILAWNLLDEVTTQMAHIREWNGRFVTPIPKVHVLG